MKTIPDAEQKIIMLDMLKYVDSICRKNNIKYSLIGGSLIGAIRHHGFIPWDDDIDIVLLKDDYKRLKRILDKEKGIYQTLKEGRGGECYTFTKLIDTRTQIKEGETAFCSNDGIYLDIFCYCNTSNNSTKRKRHYKRMHSLLKMMSCMNGADSRFDLKSKSLSYNVKLIVKKCMASIISRRMIIKMHESQLNKYDSLTDSEYVISCWPLYGYRKEIQRKSDVCDYMDADFEGINVMIFTGYDRILRTTFGDYMALPPESEQISKHKIEAWWREDE